MQEIELDEYTLDASSTYMPPGDGRGFAALNYRIGNDGVRRVTLLAPMLVRVEKLLGSKTEGSERVEVVIVSAPGIGRARRSAEAKPVQPQGQGQGGRR